MGQRKNEGGFRLQAGSRRRTDVRVVNRQRYMIHRSPPVGLSGLDELFGGSVDVAGPAGRGLCSRGAVIQAPVTGKIANVPGSCLNQPPGGRVQVRRDRLEKAAARKRRNQVVRQTAVDEIRPALVEDVGDPEDAA